MNRYRNILIDANNLFHRNHEKLKYMTFQVKEANLITGGIYGSMRSVWKIEKEYLYDHPESRVWILFDNAKSKETMRRDIDPSYKLNRKRMPISFYRSLDYFRFMLMHSSDRYSVVYGTGYEADDIAPVILDNIDLSHPTLVVSEDLDWSRLIGWKENEVDHLMKGEVYNRLRFNDEFNFIPTTNRVIMYKTIRGDTVDNIPVGVKNINEKIVISLIENYSDIYELLENLDYIPYLSSNAKEKFREAKPRLRLNHELVSFVSLEHGNIKECIYPSKFNPKILELLYDSLGFDIEKFDKRVFEYHIKNAQTEKGLFEQPIKIRHL